MRLRSSLNSSIVGDNCYVQHVPLPQPGSLSAASHSASVLPLPGLFLRCAEQAVMVKCCCGNDGYDLFRDFYSFLTYYLRLLSVHACLRTFSTRVDRDFFFQCRPSALFSVSRVPHANLENVLNYMQARRLILERLVRSRFAFFTAIARSSRMQI